MKQLKGHTHIKCPGSISIEQIRNAYRCMAKVITLYGDAYLPVFQRLHEELQTAEAGSDLKALALKIGS